MSEAFLEKVLGQAPGGKFKPKSDECFDGSGIVAHMATCGGKRRFQNPHDAGFMEVTLSSMHSYNGGGKPRDSLGGLTNTVQMCCTDNCPAGTKDPPKIPINECIPNKDELKQEYCGQFYVFDFKDKRIRPTSYELRDGSGGLQAWPRTWELQASDDGLTWRVLRVHKDDDSINAFNGTARWPIDGTDTESLMKVKWPPDDLTTTYRFFRVLQTGNEDENTKEKHTNFIGTDHLAISGFELYGTLTPN